MAAYKEDQIEISGTVVRPFTEEALGFCPGHLFITVESNNIRFFYGGKTPSTSYGHIGYSTGSYTFTKQREIENLRMISASGTAVIHYTVAGV